METTGKAPREKIMPDTPRAVGAVAVLKADLDLVEQSLVIPVNKFRTDPNWKSHPEQT